MNILILGSPHQPDEIYEYLTKTLSAYGTVFSPLERKNFTGNDEERFKRIMDLIDKADVIVAECSYPSTGMGFALALATSRRHKRIILIHNRKVGMSVLVKGVLTREPLIAYNDLSEVEEKLINFFG